jgi:acyl-coenzyme A thioesterase PaaI-like protein
MPPSYDWSIPNLGFRQRLEGDEMHGEIEISDVIRIPGTSMIRPAVIAKLADVATGALAHRTTVPRIALTVDLAVHTLGVPESGRLAMVARLVKAGRTTIIGEARFIEPGCLRPVAIAHATFTPSPRPQDVQAEARGPVPGQEQRTGAYAEQVGVRIVRQGVAEVDHHPAILQGTGTIQGGVIALLGELAAESQKAMAVVSLEVRYLSTVRVGPARATATEMGGTVVRVEVCDAGQSDRLAALIMARTRDRGRRAHPTITGSGPACLGATCPASGDHG